MFQNKFLMNIFKSSKLFSEHFWQLSRTLWIVLKYFFTRHFEMFTNLFENFLNVQEHFKKFQWNILKCFPTNSSWIFFKVQNFFLNISGNYPEHCELFSNILKCLVNIWWKYFGKHFYKALWNVFQTNMQWFKILKHSEMIQKFRTFWNVY